MQINGIVVADFEVVNGQYYIIDPSGNKSPIDLGTLTMHLNLERVNILDKQIDRKTKEIQERNDVIAELTEFMAMCRERKADPNSSYELNDHEKALWDKYIGTKWGDASDSGTSDRRNSTWDANINALKGKIDILSNDSQLDNIKLQNLLDKRGNAFEMASSVMDVNQKSLDSINQKL